jgi:hypothetical protein
MNHLEYFNNLTSKIDDITKMSSFVDMSEASRVLSTKVALDIYSDWPCDARRAYDINEILYLVYEEANIEVMREILSYAKREVLAVIETLR